MQLKKLLSVAAVYAAVAGQAVAGLIVPPATVARWTGTKPDVTPA